MVVPSTRIIILLCLIFQCECRHRFTLQNHNDTSTAKWENATSFPHPPSSLNISETGSNRPHIKHLIQDLSTIDNLNNSSSALDALLEDTVALMETFELEKYRKRQHIPGNSYSYYKPDFTQSANRICNPGPMFAAKSSLKNCLIIGDSVSNGYFYTVRDELKDICQVQHGPLPKASGAIDTRYGLQCLDIILSTASLQTTKYDIILFNFGLHDVNFSGRFPEEYVPLSEYVNNLSALKSRLQATGARLVFALTTPVPYNKTLNKKVVEYNHAARRLMKDSGLKIIDLYRIVVKKCGRPPYKKCRIMRKKLDVHYNLEGSKILGRKVARVLRKLLHNGWSVPATYFTPGVTNYQAYSYSCPDQITHCPYTATCARSEGSPTGFGCCMLPQAVSCRDAWHCCPQGTQCSPDCTRNKCSCIIPKGYFSK